jgi:hypothetical protein
MVHYDSSANVTNDEENRVRNSTNYQCSRSGPTLFRLEPQQLLPGCRTR